MEIKVQVNVALDEGTKEFLKELFNYKFRPTIAGNPEPAKPADHIEAEAKPFPKKEMTPEEWQADHDAAIADIIAEAEELEKPKYTQAEVRARFAEAKRKGKLKEAKEIMQRIGGCDVTANLDPKFYNAVVEAVEAL